jgi:thymidylate synthase ThyX
MAERKFNDAELTVLDRFFTGVKELANIYAAKPTMPSAVWAFLTGAYSRSSLTMREKFLNTLQEVYGSEYTQVIDNLILGRNDILSEVVARAERFLSTWAVQYGHNSLKDSSTDHFAVEGISIRATKFIEWAALGAYQEKSTRYADFSQVDFVTYFMPPNVEPQAKQAFDGCLEAYKIVFDAAFAFFEEQLIDEPHAQVRARTARAKAFDVARYLLPVTTPTSLGITMPSRATEDLIRWLRSSSYEEARQIGEQLYACGCEVNPSLIKHVEVNTATIADHPALLPHSPDGTDKQLENLRQLVLGSLPKIYTEPSYYSVGVVRLSTAPESSYMHPRFLAAASLAKERLSLTESLSSIAQGLSFKPQLIASIFDELLATRGPHQAVPKALGIGELLFSGVIDFGAYRDLQRHRRGFQLRVFPTNKHGYSVPDFVADRPELLEVYKEAIANLEAVGDNYVKSATEAGDKIDPTIIEYFTVLAHNIEFTYACSVEQAIYLVELRTAPAGHASYRLFAQQMAKLLIHAIPELSTHINVCWDKTSDRRASEQSTQRKLDAITSKESKG